MLQINSVGWKILEFFANNPTKEFFVKEIARKLKISPGSSSTLCKDLSKNSILTKKKKGNLLLYRLNNESFIAREIKRLIFLSKLATHKKYFENEEYQSVVLYGSYANGEYIEKSDIDILIITNIKEEKVRDNMRILNKLGKEVSLIVMPVSGWIELKEKSDPFYKEVIANHVLLYGEKLVV